MSWNLKVPKTIFFYWGAKTLPFLRYMSVYSFKKMNPDWDIKFYKPLKLNRATKWGGKQFEAIARVPQVNYDQKLIHDLGVRPIVFDFNAIGLDNNLNEVHKSDFLRYHLLHKYGGVWADMDILFIKPMEKLLCNERGSEASSFIYYGQDERDIKEHAIGFLMGEKGNKYFGDVFAESKKNFKPKDYQGAGADLLNRKFGSSVLGSKYTDTEFLDKSAVYAINHIDHEFLYDKCNLDLLDDNSVGVHWYGGSLKVKNLLLTVNHKNFKNHPNKGTLMHLLRKHFG